MGPGVYGQTALGVPYQGLSNIQGGHPLYGQMMNAPGFGNMPANYGTMQSPGAWMMDGPGQMPASYGMGPYPDLTTQRADEENGK